MKRIVYVIGHTHPDTDSVVSAAAYAELKRALGVPEARAARAGALNPQTEYVFDRFGVAVPEFLPDLVPRVESWIGDPVPMVCETSPLMEALSLMGEAENRVLSIVDSDGRYKAALHYGVFAENVLKRINPNRKLGILTSIAHILSTVRAQPLVVRDENAVFNARLVVAALERDSFERHLKSEPVENAIVIVGDREDIQHAAIAAGARALIVTNGTVVSKAIRAFAEERNVSVLVSSYDTSNTSLLVLFSTPVGTMGDASICPIQKRDLLKTAKMAILSSPIRAVPIVDADGKVVGVFSEGDLAKEPRVEIILVDHNELSQAIEGSENYRVLEVIDHHRLGTFSTKAPIAFINKPVGSTSTIVSSLYREKRIAISKQMASILLCGILSDTVCLRSATTAEEDREIAEYLAAIADLEIEELGRDIMSAASSVASRPAEEIIDLDLKEYEASGARISVSQVEVTDSAEMMEKTDDVLKALARVREERGRLLCALMVTNVVELSSLLLVAGDNDLVDRVGYPKIAEGVYELKGVLSRKKQLMPALFELVEEYMRSDGGV